MLRGWSPLLLFEICGLVVWLGLITYIVVDDSHDSQMVALDPDALGIGPGKERWMGIFFEDQHVGYAVTRSAKTPEGATLHEHRSTFHVATFGKLQQVTTAGAALVDPTGSLGRFDFFMAAGDVRLLARGEVRANEIVMEVTQAGETSELSFPVDRPPHVGLSLESVIRNTELSVGKKISVPYFDPITLSDGEMTLEVVDVEIVTGGEEAYWVVSRFGELETRSLITPAGETIRQEGMMGMSLVRMTPEAAKAVPTTGEPVDLIALSAVPLNGRIHNPRDARRVSLRIGGVNPERVRNEPPLQTREGDVVRVEAPLRLELPRAPVLPPGTTHHTDGSIIAGADVAEWLESTPTLPVHHPEIRARALKVTQKASDRLDAVQRLVDHVFDIVEKVPSIGVPNGLEVLRSERGDCNEHTALFVSLARAAGIPTRIAAGVVYSERVGPKGAFYYHAWPEVLLGDPIGWVAVDPTFGQMPADATHIKLVEGDLDRQVEIMAVMGRLRFDLIEAI